MAKRHPFYIWLWLCLAACSAPTHRGQEVVVRLPADPEALNPVSYGNAYSLPIINLLYQSLLTVDLADNTIKPLLANSLPEVRVTDSLSYFTYELRPEAKWDNGSPITAQDVELTLKVMKSPLLRNEIIRPRFDFIRGFLPDPQNPLRFTLVCQGYSSQMDFMTGDFFILPAYLLDPQNHLATLRLDQVAKQPNALHQHPGLQAFAASFNQGQKSRDKEFLRGSGGYSLHHWETGQYLVLQKKENWWAEPLQEEVPYLAANPSAIVFKVIPDNHAALLALKGGELDVIEEIPAREFASLQRDEEFRRLFNTFTPQTHEFAFVGLNSRLPKFASRHTRQAIACLFDKDRIISATQADFAQKTVGPVNPTHTSYYNASLKEHGPSQEEAVRLLHQAGWDRSAAGWHKEVNGSSTYLTITVNYKAGNSSFENTALIFQQSAAAIGIPVTLQPLEGAYLSERLFNHQFEMCIRSISGNPFNLDFKPALHSENAGPNGMNFTGFGNRESDRLLETLRSSRDEAQKAVLLHRLQEILHEECTLIFLYFSKNRIAVSNRFSNVKVSGIKPGFDLGALSPNRH